MSDNDAIECTLRSWANIIVSGPTVRFPASEEYMGREQQITIAAARAAHEVRRIVISVCDGQQTPSFDELDTEQRRQIVEHTSHVLFDGHETDEGDQIAGIVAAAIRVRDAMREESKHLEGVTVSMPADIFAPTVFTPAVPSDALAAPDPMKEIK